MSGLREAFEEIVADVPVYGDLDRAIEQAEREQRRRNGMIAGLVAAAAAVVVVVGVLAFTRGDDGAAPSPTSTSKESASTAEVPEWTGPVRNGISLPVVADETVGEPEYQWSGHSDPHDAPVGQVDIRVVDGWGLKLREDSGLEGWLGREDQIVEYGVVIDSDRDGEADCHLALSTDSPYGGVDKYRASVTNLRTDETDQQVGSPYGYPFEFGVTSDRPEDGLYPSLYLEFLGEWSEPCAPPTGTIHWYAYASLTRDGQVTAWDYAPDRAWLATPAEVAYGGRMGDVRWGDG